MGKSTTGNKMIGYYGRREDYIITRHSFDDDGDATYKNSNGSGAFKEAKEDEMHSITQRCEMIRNSTLKVGVLDTPGFEGSYENSGDLGGTLYRRNLDIIRDIFRAQYYLNLVYFRVLYFIPVRNYLQTNDDTLQNEINILYYYFGESIFKSMVIVLTNNPFDDDPVELTNVSGLNRTERVFKDAMPRATHGTFVFCPKMVYLSNSDDFEKIYKKLDMTTVPAPAGLQLSIRKVVCMKCAVEELALSEVSNIRYRDTKVESNTEDTMYCHPFFVSRYTLIERIAGGLVNSVTLGRIPDVPGFRKSEEMCPCCKQSPGAPGCLKIGVKFQYHRNGVITSVMTAQVEHSDNKGRETSVKLNKNNI